MGRWLRVDNTQLSAYKRTMRRRRTVALALSVVLHVTALALLAVRVAERTAPAAPRATSSGKQIQIEYLPPPAAADALLPAPADAVDDGAFEASMLRLDKFNFDVAKIRARANSLFPFLTLDLLFLERVPRDLEAAQRQLADPSGSGEASGRAPALEVPDAEVQLLVDRSWTRRERWQAFAEIADLLTSSDPRRGRAADIVRGYLDQNILQPYCDGDTHDPRFWAMLENAADHADFIDFIRSYARRYPSSRTTSELLFLLDELAQGSRDVVLMLTETRPQEHLAFTRTHAPEAYALAAAIKERYARWLFDRGMDKGAIRRHYDDLRLRILETIIATTPEHYRVADAQYLAGQVLFDMNRRADAERIWRAITPISSDAYYRAYSELLTALASGPVDTTSIRRVLAAEYGRWRMFSIDRLRSFGHHCDTF
jgi:hypothetical protein